MNTKPEQTKRSLVATAVKTLITSALLLLVTTMLSLPVLAQDHQSHHQTASGDTLKVGKKGEVHFTSPVKVGDTVLKPGMYQVQHVEEGSDHVIVFREMSMPAGYRMNNTPVGKEVARIKCKIEPVAKKVSNTAITFRTNAAGEKEITEIQVAGEAFRHLL